MIYFVILFTIKVFSPHLLPHSPHFPLPLFIPLKSELKVATVVYSEGEEVSAQALGSVETAPAAQSWLFTLRMHGNAPERDRANKLTPCKTSTVIIPEAHTSSLASHVYKL